MSTISTAEPAISNFNSATSSSDSAIGTGIVLPVGESLRFAGNALVANYGTNPNIPSPVYGTLVNDGSLAAVNLVGGTLINHGLVTLLEAGLGFMDSPDFHVVNSGTIGGTFVYAVGTINNAGTFNSIFLRDGGLVENSGIIAGGGIFAAAKSTISNSGNIEGGVILGGPPDGPVGGVVTNARGGFISGAVYVYEGSVINAGTIADTGGIAVQFGGSGGRFVDDPGGIVLGKVAASNNTGAVLELASGAEIGTLSGADQQFYGFSTVAVDAGAEWNIKGKTTAYSGMSIINNGTVIENAADRLTVDGNVSGNGLVILDSTTLVLNGSVSAGQTIRLEGSDVLSLGDPAKFDGTVAGFAAGDVIDLTGTARDKITGEHFVNGVLTLTETVGSLAITFANPASFPDGFSLSAAGSGTDIRLAAASPALLSQLFSLPADPRAAFGQFSTFSTELPSLTGANHAGTWQNQIGVPDNQVFLGTPTLTAAG